MMENQRKGSLQEYFNLEGHIASTRSADAYHAFFKERGISVCLWMLRHPLALNSEAPARFLSRLGQIKSLKSPHIQILDFGIDSAGMAWAAIPALDGNPISSSGRDNKEMERCFTAAVRLVDKLHMGGIVCGDLSASSFWVNRNGDVLLAGIMGSFDTEAAATAVMPPMETLHFVSPEQRAGGTVEPASDVYALGVLGYNMLTGHYPFGDTPSMFGGEADLSKLKPVSSFVENTPAWVDEVLKTCLHPAPESRYPSAAALLQGMADARQKAIAQAEAPALRARKDVIIKKPVVSPDASLVQGAAQEEKPQEQQPESPSDILNPKFLLFALGVFVLMVAGAFLMITATRDNRGPVTSEPVKIDIPAGKHEEPQSKFLQEQANKLNQYAASDDPLAYDMLVKAAVGAQTPELRGLAEKALIDRTKRLALPRSSEQLRQWLRTVPAEKVPASYESLLESLNTSVPQIARDKALRAAYATEPRVAMRFAAALALDAQNPEDYHEVISQMTGDALNMEDAASHSVLSLILADPELSLIFGEDVMQRRTEIPAGDLIWILKILGDRNDLNVRGFAAMAVERDVLSPGRKYVMSVVSQREDLSPEVLNALVRVGAGSARRSDLAAFGRWYDMQAEKILYAIMADYKDQNVILDAFDIVAGKSLTVEPAASLIPIIKRDYADKKLELAPVIGMLSSLDVYPLESVLARMSVFDPLARDTRVTNTLMKSGDPRLARIVIERYSNRLGTSALISLLSHEDPNVRMSAVRALKGQNDIAVLKLVIDQYEQEKDPEVIKTYRENFWMLKSKGPP